MRGTIFSVRLLREGYVNLSKKNRGKAYELWKKFKVRTVKTVFFFSVLMALMYDSYHKSTIFAWNFTSILCMLLLKPVKTSLMLWLHGNDSILRALLALLGILYKFTQCHTTLGGLSSVCAKLLPASSKNNEILKINVLQKFMPRALFANFLKKTR